MKGFSFGITFEVSVYAQIMSSNKRKRREGDSECVCVCERVYLWLRQMVASAFLFVYRFVLWRCCCCDEKILRAKGARYHHQLAILFCPNDIANAALYVYYLLCIEWEQKVSRILATMVVLWFRGWQPFIYVSTVFLAPVSTPPNQFCDRRSRATWHFENIWQSETRNQISLYPQRHHTFIAYKLIQFIPRYI